NVWRQIYYIALLCALSYRAFGCQHFYFFRNFLKSSVALKQNSDAKLYAPSVDEIEENCERWFLHCYMLELHMVLSEELIEGDDTDCIAHFLYNSPKGSCPACEAMALRNSTTFLDNLKSLLEKYEAS
uniref:Interleukin-15 n=1 Tax=Periophthalmus magnuspinnatus TaxID=409849 RepID=A0A3B3ZGB3_9GOBI